MTDCTATLATATVTDEVVDPNIFAPLGGGQTVPDGVAVIRRGDRLLRLDLHPLTCVVKGAHPNDPRHIAATGEDWDDGYPGATPHVPTNDVSDAEVEAARAALREWGNFIETDDPVVMRAVLVAVKQAAQEVEA